jgi:hypothetical protein
MEIFETKITLWYDHLSHRHFDEGKYKVMIWENALGANVEMYCDNDSALKQLKDCQRGGERGGQEKEEEGEVIFVK